MARQSEVRADGGRAEVASLDALAQVIAAALKPSAVDSGTLAGLRARILAAAGEVAQARTQTIRGRDVEWRESWPGVWVKVLKRDLASGIQLALLRLEPGATVPGHAHARDEECVVIEGELLIGPLVLHAGDLHVAPSGTSHPPITTRSGALAFVRCEIIEPAA